MRSFAVVLASAVLLVTAPVAALGATTSIDDPSGDGFAGTKLDVTSATLANRAHGIRVKVEFVKVAKGDLVVFLKLKGHKPFRVVSEYRPGQGTLENYIVGGATTEDDGICPGLNAAWSTSEDTATLRIPAHCLDDGDYDEARFKILTEVGPDADLAPQAGDNDLWRWSAYASRG